MFKKLATEPYPNSFVSWKQLHTLILHEPIYYLLVQQLPSLEMYQTRSFLIFHNMFDFFAKGFHPMPSPRSGWQSFISCPRLCVQHTHGQLVIICKKLPVIAPCGRDKRQDCALRESITYLIHLRQWPTWYTLALFYNTFIIIHYMFRALYAHHQEVELYWCSIWYCHSQ